MSHRRTSPHPNPGLRAGEIRDRHCSSAARSPLPVRPALGGCVERAVGSDAARTQADAQRSWSTAAQAHVRGHPSRVRPVPSRCVRRHARRDCERNRLQIGNVPREAIPPPHRPDVRRAGRTRSLPGPRALPYRLTAVDLGRSGPARTERHGSQPPWSWRWNSSVRCGPGRQVTSSSVRLPYKLAELTSDFGILTLWLATPPPHRLSRRRPLSRTQRVIT